jgi:hypothetical protein
MAITPILTKTRNANPRSKVFLNANGAGGFFPPAPKSVNMLFLRLRLYCDFDDPVQTLAKQLVGVDDLVQGKCVRNERNQVQAAVTHEFD